MVVLIEYPPCSTCKKAKAFLKAHNIAFKTRHIVDEAPTKEELFNWMKDNDIHVDKYYNTHGKSYRELGLKNQKDTLTEEKKTTLLSRDGMLIKRPILIIGNRILIGFKQSEWISALKTR